MAFYFRLDHRAKLMAAFSPKCGSTTLRTWLRALAVHGDPSPAEPPQQPFFVDHRQASAFPDYFRVLFLRDPLRRLVSFYAYWVVRHPGLWTFADHQRRFWLHSKSFRRFMYVLEHLQRHGMRLQHHLEAQLAHTDGMEFDRVVLVEQLPAALLELNQQFGLEFPPPHKLRTRYTAAVTEPVADRSPRWFRHNGIPKAAWFFDPELEHLAERLYAQDLACYRQHGGQTVVPAYHLADAPDPAGAADGQNGL